MNPPSLVLQSRDLALPPPVFQVLPLLSLQCPSVHDDRAIPAEELNFTGLTLTQPMEFSSQSWGYTEAFQSQHKAPLLAVQAWPSPARYKRKSRWAQSNCLPAPRLVLSSWRYVHGRHVPPETLLNIRAGLSHLVAPAHAIPQPGKLFPLFNTYSSLGSHFHCHFLREAIYGRHC